MHNLANISQFESLMNTANMGMGSHMVFNDGGIWKSDGWHSINEVPPVDPDDGWNDMRRTDPEEFVRCGMVSPDDGKNWLRLANPEKFRAEELVNRLDDLVKKRNGYKQEKRRLAAQKEIAEKSDDLIKLVVRGDLPYNPDRAEPYLEKLQEEENLIEPYLEKLRMEDKLYELRKRLEKTNSPDEYFEWLPNIEECERFVEMAEKGTLPQSKPGEDFLQDWYPRFKGAIKREKERTEPEKETDAVKLVNIPLSIYELGGRTRQAFRDNGINTIGDLCKTTRQDLLGYGMRKFDVEEVERLLGDLGLDLAPETINIPGEYTKDHDLIEPEEEPEFGPDMKPLPIDIELEQDWSGLTEEEINEQLAKASKESGLMDADYIMSKFKVG